MIKEFVNAQYGVIKTTLVEEKPYFCLKDLGNILDIKNVNEIRSKIPSSDIKTINVDPTNKRKGQLFISAEHISKCVFSSKKPEAELINDWIYRSILPELLKYGEYAIDDFKDPDVVIKFLDEYQDLKIRNNVLETNRRLDQKKIDYINKLLGTTNCIDFELVHLVIRYKGIQLVELFRILRMRHVINEANHPYQEFCDRKLFRKIESHTTCGGQTIVCTRTYVYKSGIAFIERILKEHEVKVRVKAEGKLLYN